MKSKLTEWTRTGMERKNIYLFAKIFFGIGLLYLLVLYFSPSGEVNPFEELGDQPITKVQRGTLRIEVSETGTIHPRKQIVLKNETDREATIIFVVPEGKIVKEGELLVELDSMELENQLVERRLRVMNDEAELVAAQENLKVTKNQNEASIDQAELAYKFAVQDLEKYKDGEYPKLRKETEANLKLAEAQLKQAEEALNWSKILYKEKYLSQSELQQDELNTQKAELDLQSAAEDLRLLDQYTYQRQIDQLESDVRQAELALQRAKDLANADLAQAEANLKSEESGLIEERDRLQRDERRFENTKIYAPIDGRVLYATSVGNRWRRDDDPIDVGTLVDERDAILYLPTASEFNVDVMVTEVDLNKVMPGLPAFINVDAIPDRTLTGKVTDIAQFPDPDSRYLNPNLKLYKTTIEMDPTEVALRNGMSCQIEILVEDLEDVLYVPLQSVVRLGGKPVVFVVDPDDTIRPQEVVTGMDNSRFVHIKSGLEEGQRILLAPPLEDRRNRERNNDPEMEEPDDEEMELDPEDGFHTDEMTSANMRSRQNDV